MTDNVRRMAAKQAFQVLLLLGAIVFFSAGRVLGLEPLPAGISIESSPPLAQKSPLASGRPLPASIEGMKTPFLPYLDYLIDESGTLDVDEVALQDRTLEFQPLKMELLPRKSGTCWLRFSLAPLEQGQRPSVWLLDMGESSPGTPVLYTPQYNGLNGVREWREVIPSERHVLLLPEAGPEEQLCYIRLPGLPGPWFSPTLRSPHDAATNWESLARPAAVLTLGVVMLLCMLRWFSEQGQWRIWTGFFVAASLVHGILGLPAVDEGHVTLENLASVLMPGVALMLLPHVGRHMLRCREHSRALDIQLFLLSLVGAAVALLPLVPGQGWLARFLELWPLCTLLFIPTALGAAFMGLPGSKRFLSGCVLPPIFTAFGLMGLEMGDFPSGLLAACPLWGVALAALIIAATRTPRHQKEEGTDENPILLEHPLDDPNLRLIPHQQEASADLPRAPKEEKMTGTEVRTRQLEDALRLPLDQLMREGAALGHCSLPPAVRQHADNMLAQARILADIISNPDQVRQEQAREESTRVFNLQHLVREAHDSVASAAESANIGLAWYMPPYLGHIYKGAPDALRETLCLLLESSVRATRHGSVHLSVRRVPESADPGHLLFTITDTGVGTPPRDRSSLALARTWELTGAHNGYLGLECSPSGATIAFTLHLVHVSQRDDAPIFREPLVLICAESALDRQSLAHAISELRCRTVEARSLDEALQLHKGDAAVLLVLEGRLAVPSSSGVVRQFHEMARDAGLPFSKVLGITPDDHYWKALGDAGFTHALLAPADAEAMRHTVQEILEEYASWAAANRPATVEAGEGEAEAEFEASSPQNVNEGEPSPAGRPSLQKLFGENGQESPVTMSDLNVLPDLLRFAEEQGKARAGASSAGEQISSNAPAEWTPPLSSSETVAPVSARDDAEFLQAAGFGGPVWSGDESATPEPPDGAQPDKTDSPSVTKPSERSDPLPPVSDVAPEQITVEPQPTPAEAVTPAAVAEPQEKVDLPLLESVEEVGEPVPVKTQLLQTPQESANERDANTPQTPSPVARSLPAPASDDAQASVKPQPTPVDAAAVRPDLPLLESEEWVGDPVPVKAQLSQTLQESSNEHVASTPQTPSPAAPHSPGVSVSEDEWVGEPTPIRSPAPPQETTASSPESEKNRNDFEFLPWPADEKTLPPASCHSREPGKDFLDFIEGIVADHRPQDASGENRQPTVAVLPDDFLMTPQAQPVAQPRSHAAADAATLLLVERLDKAMTDAQQAFSIGQTLRVGEAAARIAGESEAHALRSLARMARCVEQAGKHRDMNALKDLLPELAVAIERNRIALTQHHQS